MTITGPINLDEPLEHTDWVRAIAQRLVHDESVVDDLVQQTWLAALESPPQRSTIRGWLRRVVTNFARKRARDNARRERRELEMFQATAVASEVVQEVNAHQEMVAAVLRLSEPFRSTVLRRYFKGHRLAEIAETDGVALVTVRTCLHRAIALLRSDLKATLGIGWVAQLSTLIEPTFC